MNLERYKNVTSQKHKKNIRQEIVQLIGETGRFLEGHESEKGWVEITMDEALTKVTQALNYRQARVARVRRKRNKQRKRFSAHKKKPQTSGVPIDPYTTFGASYDPSDSYTTLATEKKQEIISDDEILWALGLKPPPQRQPNDTPVSPSEAQSRIHFTVEENSATGMAVLSSLVEGAQYRLRMLDSHAWHSTPASSYFESHYHQLPQPHPLVSDHDVLLALESTGIE